MSEQFKTSENLSLRIKSFSDMLDPKLRGIFMDLILDHSLESVDYAIEQADKRYKQYMKSVSLNLATLLR
jgi:hypothetical protein